MTGKQTITAEVYPTGTKLFVIHDNRIKSGPVLGVSVHKSTTFTSIKYSIRVQIGSMRTPQDFNESKVFRTKQELLDSL